MPCHKTIRRLIADKIEDGIAKNGSMIDASTLLGFISK